MLPELHEIRERRKQLNLTQLQLAELSKVSQSLIAKIENEQTIPSYENAKKLFDCLERISEAHSVTAKDIMQLRVVTIQSNAPIKKAIQLMEKRGFSQLPVVENEKVVGTVSENGLLPKIENGSLQKLNVVRVEGVMEEALPQIQLDTPFRVVGSLLEHAPAVLVVQKGKPKGIISKSDLLKTVLDKKITKYHRLV